MGGPAIEEAATGCIRPDRVPAAVTQVERILTIGLGVVLALVGAGCLEVEESAEPSPGAPAPTSPADGQAGTNASGGTTGGPSITVISEGGAGGSATGGGAVLTQNQAQEFDVSAASRAGARNVNVQLSAPSGPATVVVLLKERDTGRIVEERTVVVERGNTTNLFVNTTGKDNVVVVTEAVSGTAQVNVAAQQASARIGNETDVDAGGSVNIGGTQVATSVENTAVGGNATSVTGVAPGAGSRIGDTTSANTTQTTTTNVTTNMTGATNASAQTGVGQEATAGPG